MSENLTGKKIKDTYVGLIKTNDNLSISENVGALTDGLGNELPIEISTTDVNFKGNVDFTNATVSGLNIPSGGGGLVNDQGINSIKVDDSLVSTPANAGFNAIAIGGNANAGDLSVAIGDNANANDQGVNIGALGGASGFRAVAIGIEASTIGNFTIAIQGRAFSENAIGIAADVLENANNTIAIGSRNQLQVPDAIAIGISANPNQAGISIGSNTSAGITAVALGHHATAVDDAVALGAGISAENAGWTKTTNLELRDIVDAVDDSAAAGAGVPVGGLYHNAGVVRVRLV